MITDHTNETNDFVPAGNYHNEALFIRTLP